MEAENPVAIEHQNVPENHQGLHHFLYSSDDEHTVAATDNARLEDSEAKLLPLEAWCELSGNAKISGVYAVLDCDRRTQYIHYSRNVALSLRGHLTQLGSEICAFVRVQPFKFPKREEMEKLRDAWIAELGTVPSGNADTSDLWAGTVGEAAIAAMSPEERKAYEEKKLKLRKAMADTALINEGHQEASEAERRQKLEAAVTNDDWSGVIQQQTQETKPSA